VFYAALGIAVALFELSIPSGVYACISVPLVLAMAGIGFWAFQK
jgi:hypothetical protein